MMSTRHARKAKSAAADFVKRVIRGEDVRPQLPTSTKREPTPKPPPKATVKATVKVKVASKQKSPTRSPARALGRGASPARSGSRARSPAGGSTRSSPARSESSITSSRSKVVPASRGGRSSTQVLGPPSERSTRAGSSTRSTQSPARSVTVAKRAKSPARPKSPVRATPVVVKPSKKLSSKGSSEVSVQNSKGSTQISKSSSQIPSKGSSVGLKSLSQTGKRSQEASEESTSQKRSRMKSPIRMTLKPATKVATDKNESSSATKSPAPRIVFIKADDKPSPIKVGSPTAKAKNITIQLTSSPNKDKNVLSLTINSKTGTLEKKAESTSEDLIEIKSEPGTPVESASPNQAEILNEKDVKIEPYIDYDAYPSISGELPDIAPLPYPASMQKQQEYLHQFGLVNRTELWKMRSVVNNRNHRLAGGKLRRVIKPKIYAEMVCTDGRGLILANMYSSSDDDSDDGRDTPHVSNKEDIASLSKTMKKQLSGKMHDSLSQLCQNKIPVISLEKVEGASIFPGPSDMLDPLPSPKADKNKKWLQVPKKSPKLHYVEKEKEKKFQETKQRIIKVTPSSSKSSTPTASPMKKKPELKKTNSGKQLTLQKKPSFTKKTSDSSIKCKDGGMKSIQKDDKMPVLSTKSTTPKKVIPPPVKVEEEDTNNRRSARNRGSQRKQWWHLLRANPDEFESDPKWEKEVEEEEKKKQARLDRKRKAEDEEMEIKEELEDEESNQAEDSKAPSDEEFDQDVSKLRKSKTETDSPHKVGRENEQKKEDNNISDPSSSEVSKKKKRKKKKVPTATLR